jgi:hypothetical protein
LRSHVRVIKHGVLKDLARPNKGGTAQWVDVVCADGRQARLINTSQSVVKARYGPTVRKRVVTSILRFAVGYDLESDALTCLTNGVVVGDLNVDKHRSWLPTGMGKLVYNQGTSLRSPVFFSSKYCK